MEKIHKKPRSLKNQWVNHFEYGGVKAKFNPGIVIHENHQMDVLSNQFKKSTTPGIGAIGWKGQDKRISLTRIVFRGYFVDADSELVKTRDVLNALQANVINLEDSK